MMPLLWNTNNTATRYLQQTKGNFFSLLLCRLRPGSVQFSIRRSNAITSNFVKHINSPCRSVLPAHRSAATTRVTSIQCPPLKERNRHSSTRPHYCPQFLCAFCRSVNIHICLMWIIYRHFL